MKTILVTGGTSGIGKACVERFAQKGETVYFTYRTRKKEAQALEKAWPNAHSLPFDQGKWESHENLVARLPTIDVLVNNAALGSTTVDTYTQERHLQDQALMQVNAVGPLWLTNALLPEMLDRKKGTIIFVSSVGGGIATFPQFRIADAMSKAAVAYMAKHFAAQTVHTKINVYAVCPGATETAMLEASTLAHLTKKQRERFEHTLPKRRLIAPDEIAALISFLATKRARVLHGAVLDASFGLGVHPGLIT
jgi:NAD(P)-dependent dehydrogenase (short-subunit alcohol dehydrogenase family)